MEQEAVAHVQLPRPAVVLMDLRLPEGINGLAAGHVMEAVDGVRDICFAGERSARLGEHTAPAVLWYFDGEPMDLEALHRILARTLESD